MKFLFFSILTIILGPVAFSQTYNGEFGSIPDTRTPKKFSVNVSGLPEKRLTKRYGLKRVCLNIQHPYVQNLILKLYTPDGTSIILMSNSGGSGDNLSNTCFNDDSTSIPIKEANAPFNGNFKPNIPIGFVNNSQIGEGQWLLEILDDALFDEGVLLNWSLEFGFDAPANEQLNSDLPILQINTLGNKIKDSSQKIFAKMKLVNRIGRNSSLDSAYEYNGNISIGIRGNFSATLPQKSYSFVTYNALQTEDTNVILLDLPKEHDWILLANYNDKSFIRNMLMYNLFAEMGHYASRLKPCEVILNGDYIGVYLLVEKIKVDEHRVNIKKFTSSDTTSTSISGGYIFSHDYYEDGWYSELAPKLAPTRYFHFNYEYPSSTKITQQQASFLKNYIDDFQTKLYKENYDYRDFIDVPSFIDYYICAEFSWNEESFRKSMFFHKDRNGKLVAGPIWDFDFALKRHVYTNPTFSGWSYNLESYGTTVSSLPWWIYLMKDSNFVNETRCRWVTLRDSILSISSLNKKIDSMAFIFHEAEIRHYARWPILGKSVGTPELEPISTTYQEEINSLKEMIAKRVSWLDDNVMGRCNLYPKKNELFLYPNPVDHSLNVKFKTNPLDESMKLVGMKEIYISNLLAQYKKVFFTNTNTQQVALDISTLQKGFYILKVIDSNGDHHTSKFYKN